MNARLLAMVITLLLAVTSSTSAQVARPGAISGQGGITVVGRGSLRVRPDVVRFTARFSLRPTSMDALLSQVDAVTQGFVQAGVDANAISREIGPLFAPQMQNQGIELTVNGTARPAPPAQLAAMYARVMTSLNPITGVTFQSFNASYGLQDCAAGEEQARAAALADARRRAQAIAHDAGVTLGDLLNASETTLGPVSCNVVQQGVQNGSLDMSPQPMVTVNTQITVTYSVLRP
jgi:uncharacterized protein YggE